MIASALQFTLALLPFTLAAREFTNHGTTSGWSNQYIDAGTQGKISDSTSASLDAGGQSLKFEQTYLGSSYSGRYHAEKHYANGYKRDDEKYYGFAFRLHSQWEFDPQSYNIAQFGADFGDINNGACDDFSPTTMVWINETRLMTRVKRGQMLQGQKCPPKDRKWDCSLGPNCQNTDTFQLFDGIKAGVWNRLVLRVKWKSDQTGEFQAWLNGTELTNKGGLQTTLLDDHRAYQFRVGIYANSWYDEHKMIGNQANRQLWIDEIGVGSSYKDVDPAEIAKSA